MPCVPIKDTISLNLISSRSYLTLAVILIANIINMDIQCLESKTHQGIEPRHHHHLNLSRFVHEVIPQRCLKSYTMLCVKFDIIRFVNKISDKKEVQLIPGVYLEKIVPPHEAQMKEMESNHGAQKGTKRVGTAHTETAVKKNNRVGTSQSETQTKEKDGKLTVGIEPNSDATSKNTDSNDISTGTGKPEEQIKRYDQFETDVTLVEEDKSDKHEPKQSQKNYKKESIATKRKDNETVSIEERITQDSGLDRIDVDYYIHLLSQNKSGDTSLSTDLLDDDFVDYLIRKVDRYFQTRNLKIQIVESIRKIDREVFGGILPSAETGRYSSSVTRKRKIPTSLIAAVVAALGLILFVILAVKTILLSKLALILAFLQFLKHSGHSGYGKYSTGAATTLSDGSKNIEITAGAKRRNSECAAMVTHYNQGQYNQAVRTLGGDSTLVGGGLGGHNSELLTQGSLTPSLPLNYVDLNRRNVLQRADYVMPYIKGSGGEVVMTPNDYYRQIGYNQQGQSGNGVDLSRYNNQQAGYYRQTASSEPFISNSDNMAAMNVQYHASNNEGMPASPIVLNELVTQPDKEDGRENTRYISHKENQVRRRSDLIYDKEDDHVNRRSDEPHEKQDLIEYNAIRSSDDREDVEEMEESEKTPRPIFVPPEKEMEGAKDVDAKRKIPRNDFKNKIDNMVDNLRENYHPVWKNLRK